MPKLAKCIRAASAFSFALASALAGAQSTGGTRVTVTFGDQNFGGQVIAGGEILSCTGTPTCTYSTSELLLIEGCSNSLIYNFTATMTGLNLAQSGPIQGSISYSVAYPDILPNGTCTVSGVATFTWQYAGQWNLGSRYGTLNLTGPDCILEGVNACAGIPSSPFTGFFTTDTVAPPPFPMTVRSTITPVTATASADIQYRPEDVGKSSSVFVFALAPATRVVGASLKTSPLGIEASVRKGAKADPVPCVLAQLNSSGQLKQVSSSDIQSYLTTVLSAQGATVDILNNASTPAIAGATFFVGYGTTSGAMIDSGINRAAVTVPGTVECRPQAPQTGWWWNPAEGGRGFSIEASGNRLFMAAFLYNASGQADWFVASGNTTLEGAMFNGRLLGVRNGQTLGGAYRKPDTIIDAGAITLTFNSATRGTMIWPGGVVPIERQNLVPGGLTAQPQANRPENGWWWNAAEDGRGFFIEWQNGYADLAGYMYDDAGNPVWYISVFPTPNAAAFSGNWWQYGGGQSLTGAYRPATRINDNVAPVTIQFTSSSTATMTLPGGRQVALTRFRF